MNTEHAPASADTESADRISRRVALRRAAALGGAVVFAAPAVTRLGGSPAYASPGTPAPPPPPPPDPPPPPPEETIHGISYVGLVFTCNGDLWRAKWESESGWQNVTSVGNSKWQALPHCSPPGRWDEAQGLPPSGFNAPPDKGAIQVDSTIVDGEVTNVCFTLPEGCQFEGAAGVAMGGTLCASASGNDRTMCVAAPVQA